MARIIITITVLSILAFIVTLIYCAMVIESCSDENIFNNDKKKNNKLMKNQICQRCKTGKDSYDLDPKSDMCPNIHCCKNGECPFYKPIE